MNQSQGLRLAGEVLPQVQVPGTRALRPHPAAFKHFRTNFIAGTADPDATMHYQLISRARCRGGEPLHSAPENPAGSPPPARMEQGDSTSRGHEVHRDTVGYGNGE
jgi:hypothetical protein